MNRGRGWQLCAEGRISADVILEQIERDCTHRAHHPKETS
jgi:hypothetical protein